MMDGDSETREREKEAGEAVSAELSESESGADREDFETNMPRDFLVTDEDE